MKRRAVGTIRVVGETAGVQMLFLPGKSDTLLITFNGLGTGADGQSFAADQVARELGLPALGFMSRGGNWFPRPDMETLSAQAMKLINQFPNRFLYGFSMGGYAALKYSRLLKATHVLAVGPQWSIDPEVAPWERRYIPYLLPWHKTMQIVAEDCAGEMYIVFDDRDPDARHAAEIGKVAHCHEVRASFTGHDVWLLFFSIGAMRDVISAILARDVAALRRIVRARRREMEDFESRVYFGRASQLFAQGRLTEAEAAARRTLRCLSVAPGVGFLLSMILVELNRPGEAESVIRAEMAREPNLPWLAVYLSRALEAQERYVEALEALTPLCREMPHLVEAAEAYQRLSALV